MTKRIALNAFNMATPGHHAPGLWKHPRSDAHRYADLDHWLELARTLERGRFDALFMADVLGPYDVYGGSAAASLRAAAQVPANDPFSYISGMAAVTQNLGFVVTAAVTFEHPYALARRLSTLDHLTKGRMGWNVVTSYLESAARNFGKPVISHDERYEIADEFMDVMYRLWEDSWEDDAVELNYEADVYVNPDKVHPIGHKGKYFEVDGFNLVEPSPQKTPVIFQAGASSRGRQFSTTHAEGLFVNVMNAQFARTMTDNIREMAVSAGRSRDDVKIYPLITTVVADSDAEAERTFREYSSYASREGAMALFGGWTGVNLADFDPDVPLAATESNAIRTVLDQFTKRDPSRKWTPADIADYCSIGGPDAVIVGSPETVADEIEHLIDDGGLDGINLAHAIGSVDFTNFVDTVVPELQKRGRVWKEYEGTTLREYMRGPGNNRLAPTHPGRGSRG